MKKPNFLIIGAQKAATTWLADMLRQHPEICIPEKKEVHFFNKTYNYEKGLDWYERHFTTCNAEEVRGEATPNYLWTSTSQKEIQESDRVRNIPEKVHSAYPEAKLIVSLREPVDRAISAYRTLIRGGHVSPRHSISEVTHRHGIVSMGCYEMHIRRWLEHFQRSQFLFLIFEEDIKINRRSTLRKIYRFLEVEPTFIPNNIDERKHPSLGPLYRILLYYFSWAKKPVKKLLPNLNRGKLPFRNSFAGNDVTDEEREHIKENFADCNHNLPELIGRTPDWWSPKEDR
jgi:hypothetical protein